VIIKAVAGGGGKGIVVVTEPDELVPTYEHARAGAGAVFGDDRVYIERYLAHARHVEVQVLCDNRGNGIHLGTRDCSVQRRHQKLLEEGPAPGLLPTTTDAMSDAALKAALAVGYTGVGTFEFLVDEHERHYFMEINTRLQVEHPVTEAITGVDLVREQLLVAAGHPLTLRQQDVVLRGVAIECRVNGEDPAREFVPTAGRLDTFAVPGGPFTRVDTHAFAGYLLCPHYDSLLAKVIVWAPDRDRAIARMRRALAEFAIAGDQIRTTREFLSRVLEHPDFVAATHTTSLASRLLAVHSFDG
jgi:acetyl-CoA carboxylase biotin carboxylase subunit